MWALLLLIISIVSAASAQLFTFRRSAPLERINFRDYGACDGTTDDTAALTTALSDAAGKTLHIPSGCEILVAGPSAGACQFWIPTKTTIEGGGRTSRILLARTYCSGGTTPGAYCDGSVTCAGGGSCVFDVGSAPFAPTSGSDYTLFCAASSSADIVLRDFGIDVRQDEYLYGRCAFALNDGTACDKASDCTGGGSCFASSHGLSGDGNIRPIDLTNATDALVDHVTVYGQQYGRTFALGRSGILRFSSNDRFTTAFDPDILFQPRAAGRNVERAVTVGALGVVNHNRLQAKNYGVYVDGDSTDVVSNEISGRFGNDGTNKSVGVFNAGSHGRITDNRIWSAYYGVKNKPPGGSNIMIARNRIAFGVGSAVVTSAAGNLVMDNYLAWTGTNGSGRGIVEIGDGDTVGNVAAHPQVIGNLIQTSQTGMSGVKFVNVGKRCQITLTTAPGYGTVCSASTDCACSGNRDCPGSTCSGGFCVGGTACASTETRDALVASNNIISAPSGNGIDFTTITNDTTVHYNAITANSIGSLVTGTGFAFPVSAVTSISDTNIVGNSLFASVTTPISNWSDAYGVYTSNTSSVVGTTVQWLTSVAANDDPTEQTIQCRQTTTDGTQTAPTTPATCAFPVTPNKVRTLTATVVAHCTGGVSCTKSNGAEYTIVGTCKNNGGTTAAIAGSPDVIAASEDVSGWDATIDCDNTTDTIRIRVTGAAATNITWHATVRTMEVGT